MNITEAILYLQNGGADFISPPICGGLDVGIGRGRIVKLRHEGEAWRITETGVEGMGRWLTLDEACDSILAAIQYGPTFDRITLRTLKAHVTRIEPALPLSPCTELLHTPTDDRILHVCLTAQLKTRCRRGRVWKSVPFLTALKNTAYGLRPERTRSRGGADGIFRLDRSFHPPTSMMKKVFDRFLDRPDGEALAAHLNTRPDALSAIRVVSHHMRLLGVHVSGRHDWIVLVDYDNEK